MTQPKFKLGDLVRKTKGSQWSGIVVGTYSTELTPEGYAVESSTEKGSVQIYPVGALEEVTAPVESLQEEVERLRKASVPICIGQPLIQILATEGQWISMDGQSLIAADCLFRKDPYIELEKAWQEAGVLRQDNEHHVNRCYAAEKARNEAQEEVKRMAERLSQTDLDVAHYARLCDGKDREIAMLSRQIAAAIDMEDALAASFLCPIVQSKELECFSAMRDTALKAWQHSLE